MGESTFLVVLSAVAVVILVIGLVIRRRLNPTPAAKTKAGRHKGDNESEDKFAQNINAQLPLGKGDIWQDDNLSTLKERKDQQVYAGDKEVEKDDGEHESWEKYS